MNFIERKIQLLHNDHNNKASESIVKAYDDLLIVASTTAYRSDAFNRLRGSAVR